MGEAVETPVSRLGLRCPDHDHPDKPVVTVPEYRCPVDNAIVKAIPPHLIDDDPPMPCAYHPPEKKGLRCGKPTVQMMVGGGLNGMWFLAICPECASLASIEGITFIFAHRFGSSELDLPISSDG